MKARSKYAAAGLRREASRWAKEQLADAMKERIEELKQDGLMPEQLPALIKAQAAAERVLFLHKRRAEDPEYANANRARAKAYYQRKKAGRDYTVLKGIHKLLMGPK